MADSTDVPACRAAAAAPIQGLGCAAELASRRQRRGTAFTYRHLQRHGHRCFRRRSPTGV